MKILAIDGNSIMNRAFYGIKMLTNRSGIATNAVTGFMNIFLRVRGDTAPDGIVCAFDMRAPTFRHKASADYKANRKGMPDELAEQMPYIKKILTAMGVKVLECEGFEADDILGTVSHIFGSGDDKCCILTGDRDSLQLITDNVTVLLHTNKELISYDPARFAADYGFEPHCLVDLKALMGDSSDNIKGVKGIGEKTAMSLIQKYNSIESLYEAVENGSVEATKSVKEKLANGKADAEQSRWLATIVTDAPIPGDRQDYLTGETDEETLSRLLTELEMNKLMEKLGIKPSADIINGREAPEKSEKIAYTAGNYFADREKILNGCPSFLLAEDGTLKIAFDGKYYNADDKAEVLEFLSSGCDKFTTGAKPAYRYCLENGTELRGVKADAEIMGYLLDSEGSDLSVKKLCAEYGIPEYEDDICALPQLCGVMLKETEKHGMTSLLNDIELPLTEVLASMEFYGVRADSEGIRAFGRSLAEDIRGEEAQIYFMAGHEFNIGSPRQLGTVLFEEMGLPGGKKNKTGYSTNADVLEGLRSKAPVVDNILNYRHLTKLNSTYVEGLLKEIGADGRVHSVFKQTETRTGRISSTEPNMQNIPVRTERGRQMRKFFTAADGYVLLDADYSQIELRILAHMSGDKNMQAAFINGNDIHTETAAQVFNMPKELVTGEMRRAAKAVNFGIVYGIGAFSLSKDIDVSVAEADRYIKNYLGTYSGVKKFMEKTVEDAIKNGYSETMYGRRRYIPELASKNKNIQAFGKRAAMNAPIQGTAADIIKIAMVRVFRRLREEKLDARLILQVHDELIIEASEKDRERTAAVLAEEMRCAAQLDVPLTADVGEGISWYDAKR